MRDAAGAAAQRRERGGIVEIARDLPDPDGIERGIGRYSAKALTAQERAQRYALCGQAKPLSDVAIEAREVRKAGDIQVRKLPARVHKLERAADDAMIVYLRLPASERLMFLPGQYIDILLKDGTRRSFSMANAPHDDEFVQLHVRHVPGGSFTDHVFQTMKR